MPFAANMHFTGIRWHLDVNSMDKAAQFIFISLLQLQHQEQAQQELVNGRKRRAEEATSLFDWFWESGDVPEGIEPISDLIKDELWTNPMRGGGQDAQVWGSFLFLNLLDT